jgi:RimJ/RimL family protein N-acetyltransferase
VRRVITGCDQVLGPWLCDRLGDVYAEGVATYIGLADGDNLIAGVKYDGFNGANINMHVAAEGKSWLTREFLWFTFYYPFVQLGCKRITALVDATNITAIQFDEHLGFEFEAALKDGHPNGDLLVYRMLKQDCRWHTLKRRHNAPQPQELSLPSA